MLVSVSSSFYSFHSNGGRGWGVGNLHWGLGKLQKCFWRSSIIVYNEWIKILRFKFQAEWNLVESFWSLNQFVALKIDLVFSNLWKARDISLPKLKVIGNTCNTSLIKMQKSEGNLQMCTLIVKKVTNFIYNLPFM